jgi:hypothetical protein
LCRKCGRILPSWYPRRIDIRLKQYPTKSPIDGVWWTGVRLIDIALARDLKPFMTKFAFGHCSDSDGGEIANYRTFYMPPWISLRGEKYADYLTCPSCQAVWLDYRHQRRLFLLRRDFEEYHIRQDGVTTYVSELVASIIVEQWFRKAKLIRIPLVDKPPDGERLPGDSDWAAM